MFNTKTVENIFRIMRPADEIAAEKISSSMSIDNPYVRKIIEIFVDTSGGIKSESALRKAIGELTAENEENKRIFNRFIDFYSSGEQIGLGEGYSKAHLLVPGTEGKGEEITSLYGQICPNPPEGVKEKPLTIVVSKTPHVSLSRRDVVATEVFLNFLPSIVISRCVPYFDIEFVFNRTGDSSSILNGPSLIRFLNDDTKVDDLGWADKRIVSAKRQEFSVGAVEPKENRYFESAGMEIFTSPQTLVNMSGGSRYIPVLDRTRPLLSLESAQIIVDPMSGLYSNKRMTLVMKLHDKSRLLEVSDILQLSGANRVSVWVTYGWRHPKGAADDRTNELQLYGDFINEKMLIKECYQFINAAYTFETTGQVTINCELFAQGITDVKNVALHEEKGFEEIRRLERKLSNAFKSFKERNGLTNLADKTGSKEIRSLMVFNSAMNGTFPNLKEKEIKDAIASLISILGKEGAGIDPEEIKQLEKDLNEYYSFSTGKIKDNKTLEEIRKSTAESVIADKFSFLSESPDPFIPWVGKIDARKAYDIEYKEPDYMLDIAPLLKAGSEKVVSFGKLFCSFMSPALNTSDDFEEAQIFFYTLNNLCGKASGTNIAEFPVNLENFKAKYSEYVSKYGTAVMTVDQFTSLAATSQFRNLRSAAYGFDDSDFSSEKDGSKPKDSFNDKALAFNKGRGSFQIPDIRIFSEMVYKEAEGIKAVDRLSLYERATAIKKSSKVSERILRIHIFDITCNPSDPTKTAFSVSALDSVYDNGKKPLASQAEVQKIVTEKKNDASTRRSITIRTSYGGEAQKESFNISDREKLRRLIAGEYPVLVPGMNASGILEAKLASRADPNQKAAVMTGMNSGKELQAGPRGNDVGDLPVRVIPSELELRTIGCPLLNFAQMYFVDLNTGTTVDNVYGINNITHAFSPGKFESTVKMVAYDTYAKVGSALNLWDSLVKQVEEISAEAQNSNVQKK